MFSQGYASLRIANDGITQGTMVLNAAKWSRVVKISNTIKINDRLFGKFIVIGNLFF